MDEAREKNKPDFIERASRHVSFWGLVVVGLAGLSVATDAVKNHEYTGAGIGLIASALTFIAIGRMHRRRRGPFGPGRPWNRTRRWVAEEATMMERQAPQTQVDPNEPPNA